MPISFQPAAPFNAAAIGQSAQQDLAAQRAQQLAQQYAAQGREQSQASIASSENQTRAAIASAQMQSQGFEQANQHEFAAETQRRQYEQQRQMQFNEFAFEGQKVSHQEQMQMVRQQNGLAELTQQVKDGTLTQQEAADAAFELKTGINFTQRRMQTEQAQQFKQKADLEAQQIASMQKNQAMGEKFMLDTGKMGGTISYFTDATTGRIHPVAFDPITRRYYNPYETHAAGEGKGAGEKPITRFGDDHGVFSYKNAMPEAKAEAEAAYPVYKEAGADGKEKDINAGKRVEYMQEILKKMAENHVRQHTAPVQASPESPGAQSASQAPSPQAPVQAPRQVIEQQLTALMAQYPDPSKIPPDVLQQIIQLKQARQAAQ